MKSLYSLAEILYFTQLGFNYHFYPNKTQSYLSGLDLSPNFHNSKCLREISTLILCHHLKHHESKTKYFLHYIYKVASPLNSIIIGNDIFIISFNPSVVGYFKIFKVLFLPKNSLFFCLLSLLLTYHFPPK